jgi:hypothetical protein
VSTTNVDLSRAVGVTDDPPVKQIDWRLEVDADAPAETVGELKALADDHCRGTWCIRHPSSSTHAVGPIP